MLTGFMANLARRAAERAGEPRPQRRDAAPGDILSSVPLHMGNGTTPAGELPPESPRRPSLSARSSSQSIHDVEGDESEFRDAVLDCMFKAIGLSAVDSALNPATGSSSIPASPRLVSYDSVRQKAVFTNTTNIIFITCVWPV